VDALTAPTSNSDERSKCVGSVGSVACVSTVMTWDKVSPLRWRLDGEEAAAAARLLPLFGGIVDECMTTAIVAV
jgi:hypothetical protein